MGYYKSTNGIYYSKVIKEEHRAPSTGWVVGYQGNELISRAELLQLEYSVKSGYAGIKLAKHYGHLCDIRINKEEFDEVYAKVILKLGL
tara:strand:+ start:348 stop:614 length:267 start_codon:yes stop_codon:yes gene_type:complete